MRITPFIYVATLTLMLSLAAAAQPLSIHAFVDRTTAGEAEPVTFTIEVRGDVQGTPLAETPRAQGLSLSQATPRRETSVTISNGVRTSTTRLSWVFIPDRAGYAEIGAVGITVNGQPYATDAVTVRIVPQAQRPIARTTPPSATPEEVQSEIFLVAVPDTTVAYVGQQITVDFVLYYLPELSPRNARASGSWDAPGFWREEFELRTPVQSEIVELNGRHYQAAVIKRTAFFATRSGELQIDPLSISIDVLRGQRLGGPTGPFFNPFATRYARQTIGSSGMAIRVLPLPEGAPSGFGGAVGQFDMQVARMSTQNPESVGARVTIAGNGNPATLDAPAWSEVQGVESFPPRSETRVNRSGQAITTTHTFEYVFVPGADAPSELPELEWAYFDPVGGRYHTLYGEALPLDGVTRPDEPVMAGRSADPIRRDASWRRLSEGVSISPAWYAVAGLTPPIIAVLLVMLTVGVRRRRAESEPLARARAALSWARNDARVFGPVVRRFVRERFGIMTGAMTTRELVDLLEDRCSRPEAVATIAEALYQSEHASFSGEIAAKDSVPDLMGALRAIDRTVP